MAHDAPDQYSTVTRVHDCWNRIGTRGDSSCPRLADHTWCLNCPVFEQAARQLLDRPLSDSDILDPTRGVDVARRGGGSADVPIVPDEANLSGVVGDGASSMQSALVFRVVDEWLALPTTALRQVDDMRPVHPLPHRRNRVVLGLVNVRGALTVTVSLGELLHLDRTAAGKHPSRNGYARMLVAAHRGEPVAFPVDEVEGVLRFAANALQPTPSTLAHGSASHASGVLPWCGTTIGLLDPDRVFDSLARSLR
jgi:chemotaxis-related protein WspD